jgi:hypothetical protein
MSRSFENQEYTCPRLKRLVTLTIEYQYYDSTHQAAVGYECDSDCVCDIDKVGGKGAYTWDRRLCPAVAYIKNNPHS